VGTEFSSTITQYEDSDAITAIKADIDWNATDWDTAYGWGDHSTEGYLTDITAESILDLTDTPVAFDDGKFLKSGAADVTFESITEADISDLGSYLENITGESILDLDDTPSAFDNGKVLKSTADGTEWATVAGVGDALTTDGLDQFASTTSSELAGVISDETGSGDLVFNDSPTLVTPEIDDANGNEILRFGNVASAVNYLEITNSATGDAVEIEATGDDTDIDLNLVPKGTGAVQIDGADITASDVRKVLAAMREETFIHTDGAGGTSWSTMVWIPKFVTSGFVAQPNLNGITMGGFWVDKYQSSQPDATMGSRGGTTANSPGSVPGVSQALKVPWTDISWTNAKVAAENRGASENGTATADASAANELTDTANLPGAAVGKQIKITLTDGITYIRRITGFDTNGTTIYFAPDLPSNVLTGDSYTITEYHLITAYEWASLAYLACMIWGEERRAGTDYPKGNNDWGKDTDDADSEENYGIEDPVKAGYDGHDIARVLTGSGPNSWSLTGHPLGVWDLNGNVYEWIDLLIGGGDTVAGESGTDHTVNPGFPEAGIVLPDSNGNIATLEDSDTNGKKAALPKTVGSAVNEYGKDCYYQVTEERAGRRGGVWYAGSYAGVFLLHVHDTPSYTNTYFGFRVAK